MKRDVAKAWRWFTADEALSWALAAYYAASREVDPPADDPEPEAWASRGWFAFAFHREITARICREAAERKIACDHGSQTHELHWDDADFSRPSRNGLHLVENAPDNQSAAGVDNG